MDWLGMALTFVSSYLLSKKSKWGWFVNGISCLVWGAYGIFVVHSIPIVILNIVLITNSFRGFRTWGTGPARTNPKGS